MKKDLEKNKDRCNDHCPGVLPVAPEAWKFVIGFGVLGAMFLLLPPWIGTVAGGIFVFLALFSLYFFRDGKRRIPETSDLVSPADGRVLEIADVDGEGYGRGRVVRIFLSVLDGHVQRAPCAGRVVRTVYSPGQFLVASNPRAPFANEANAIELETPRGRVMVRQIAGLIARRILCWVRPDDAVSAGDRIGLIRFGSQVDLYVPADAVIAVREGQRVRAGETVMARWA